MPASVLKGIQSLLSGVQSLAGRVVPCPITGEEAMVFTAPGRGLCLSFGGAV